MQDPKRFRTSLQGEMHPREGEEDIIYQKEAALGDLCLAVGSLNEALAYYRTALGKTASENSDTRLEVLLKVSSCLRRQGKAGEALSFVDSVAGTFDGRHRRDLLAEKATLLCLVGRYGDAAGACEEARSYRDGKHEKDAGIYLVLGHVLARLCKWREAVVCLEQAATFGRMSGDLTTLGKALNNLGIVYKNLCRFRESVRFLRKSVRVARRTKDDASLCVRLLNLANTLLKRGELAGADRAVSECRAIAASLNLNRMRILASICQARVLRMKGDLDEARDLAGEIVEAAGRLADPRVRCVGLETLGEVLCDLGDHAGARGALEQALAGLPDGAGDVEAEIKTRLAAVDVLLGRPGRARRLAEQAVNIAEEIGDLYEAGRALRVLALATGAEEDRRRCLDRSHRILKGIGASLEAGITLHARSGLERSGTHARIGDLKQAILVFRARGARGLWLKSLCGLAVAYADVSQHDKALTCLDEAAALARDDPAARVLLAAARTRVDRCLCRRVSGVPSSGLGSSSALFTYLASNLGVGALVLARICDDQEPQVVDVQGVDHAVGLCLIKALVARDGNPIIATDVAQIAAGASGGFRTVVALRLGSGRGLAAACWRGCEHAGCASPTTAQIMRAHDAISRAAPDLERLVGRRDRNRQAICVGGMVTSDPDFKATLLALPRIARGTASILICGETGTGKELVARAIHALSRRGARPFVAQNCAALPEHLLESELFGHRMGAFTGARSDKPGLLETAAGGTFLFDEVGDVSLATQAKMLRAIETGEIRRVGDTVTHPVDARFLSATNRNLEEEVEAGRFRRDLFYRLNVVSVRLPPLRDREGDVEILARLFLGRFARAAGKRVRCISDRVMALLSAYDWPGNVRQLENEIEKAVTLVDDGEPITRELLSVCIAGGGEAGDRRSLRDELRAVERRRILAALRKCDWNKTHAAKMLGDVSRPALIAKMKRLGIPLKQSG